MTGDEDIARVTWPFSQCDTFGVCHNILAIGRGDLGGNNWASGAGVKAPEADIFFRHIEPLGLLIDHTAFRLGGKLHRAHDLASGGGASEIQCDLMDGAVLQDHKGIKRAFALAKANAIGFTATSWNGAERS